jgi:hypothetical protein
VIKMAYPDKCFQPGQRVRIRQWDDMAREFGSNSANNIPCAAIFAYGMRYLCGQEFTIEEILAGRRVTFVENDDFYYSLDMIEPLYARNHHCAVGTASLFE